MEADLLESFRNAVKFDVALEAALRNLREALPFGQRDSINPGDSDPAAATALWTSPYRAGVAEQFGRPLGYAKWDG